MCFLNESVSEQFDAGIKVEAADIEQTSEEVGKVRDKMVCCGNISHWLYLCVCSIFYSYLVTRPVLFRFIQQMTHIITPPTPFLT